LSISIILSLAGDGISDDFLAREGHRQVARISGKEVVRIFGTRKEFCREYVKELNHLRMEHHAKISQGRQQLVVVEQLKMTLKGDLAGMLSAARDSKSRQIPTTSYSKLRWLRGPATR
jgi:hypothetical protein